MANKRESAVSEAEFLSVFEAAVLYAVSEDTIRRMVRDGQLLHERVRGAIRIPRPRPGFSPLVTPAATVAP